MRTAALAYDCAWQCYDELNPPSVQVLDFLETQARQIPSRPVRILDAGCGTGTHSIYLAQKIPRSLLTGIDVSQKMLSRAQEKFPQAKWICGDFFSTDLAPRSFDFVLCVKSIHLMNWRQFLFRCNRIVSNNGAAIIITGDRQDYSNIYYKHIPLLQEKDLLHYPRVRQLRETLEEIGFKTSCTKITSKQLIQTAQEVESVLKKAQKKAESLFHLVDEATLNECTSQMAISLEKEIALNGAALSEENLYAIVAKRKNQKPFY